MLLFSFLTNQENLYMIQHNSDLFYDIYNTINDHNRRQTHSFSSIFPNYFDFYVITFERFSSISLSLSLEEMKLIVIGNFFSQVSDFLRLFMISFKYGLILVRHFLIDSVFFSPLLLSSVQLLLRKLPTITGL